MIRQYCRYPDKNKRIYKIFCGMKQRCYNTNHKYYPIYGGRGIKICDEWLNDYQQFEAWALANGYANDMSIDRIDNDKGYSPDNCRWIYYKDQPKNRRSNHRVIVDGKEMNVSDVSRLYGIPISTVCYRDNQGFDILRGCRKSRVMCVETGAVYESVSEASRQTSINRGSISACMYNEQCRAGGYHWRKV